MKIEFPTDLVEEGWARFIDSKDDGLQRDYPPRVLSEELDLRLWQQAKFLIEARTLYDRQTAKVQSEP